MTARPHSNEDEDEVKRMPISEFREFGYLQEINRRILHPLGLALEVVIENGVEYIGGVWDYRDDPEGIYYADGLDEGKAERVRAEWMRRRDARLDQLGYMVQQYEAKEPLA